MREKSHRLSKELYRGRVSAAFTLCIRNAVPAFADPNIVGNFIALLDEIIRKTQCIIPVYCFMPDHQHLMITGTGDDSDILKTVVQYKQKTGYWLSKNKPGIRWQKDFYDHIIRTDENLSIQARYILDNPVRKGLVKFWQDYPHKGSVGCRLEDILYGIM